jgi:GGDEF domain-containing protein
MKMKKNLLVVADKGMYAVFKALFDDSYGVIYEDDVNRALEAIHSRPVHLVLCPEQIHRTDSFKLITDLRASKTRSRDIPALILTNTMKSDYTRRSREAGDCDVIKLPVEPISFSKQVEMILRSHVQDYEKPDSLTGMMRRRLAQDEITEMLINGVKGAFFTIDLDHFSFASSGISDNAKLAVRDVIQERARENDDVTAIANAGSFVLFVRGLNLRKDTEDYARSIIDEIHRKVQDETLYVSIGIAIAGRHGNNYEELYENSCKGLERARTVGKNAACFYRW